MVGLLDGKRGLGASKLLAKDKFIRILHHKENIYESSKRKEKERERERADAN